MNIEGFVDLLLVEDNKHDAELTMLALEEAKLKNNIIWLKDGKEALDYLFARGRYKDRDTLYQPKVILLDLKMPRVNGLEVLREIRSNEATRKMPVVVLTSSKEESDILSSYELGVNSFIVKPLDFDQFSKCIRDIGYYWALLNEFPNKTS